MKPFPKVRIAIGTIMALSDCQPIAASPAIQRKLDGTGLGADDVLAVDTKDGQIKVYVY